MQAAIVVLGVFVASSACHAGACPCAQAGLWRGLAGGFALILSTPVLRSTYLITIGMGVFFGGVFLVLLPWRCATCMRAVRATSRSPTSRSVWARCCAFSVS